MNFRNKYFIIRHGQAVSNVEGFVSSMPELRENPLTEEGKNQVKKSAEGFRAELEKAGGKIDLIYSSPLLRAKQTAEICAGILQSDIVEDERLREVDFGIHNGKDLENIWDEFKNEEERIDKVIDGIETYNKIKTRVVDIIGEIESRFTGKTFLLASHEAPLFILQSWFEGISLVEAIKINKNEEKIANAEIRQLN